MPNGPTDDDFVTLLDAMAMSAEAMFAVNDRNRIIFWNPGMRRLFGYDAHEVVGKSCAGLLTGGDTFGNRYCSDSCAIVQMARRDEPVRQFSLTLKAKDGALVASDITILRFVLPGSKKFVLAHIVRPALQKAADVQPGLKVMIGGTPVSSDARVRELTTRETEILGLLAGGLRPAEIARRLCISPVTARNHLQRIYEKIEVHSQGEAVAFAYRMNVV